MVILGSKIGIITISCKFFCDYFKFFDEKTTMFDNFLYFCSDITTKNSLYFNYGRARKITRQQKFRTLQESGYNGIIYCRGKRDLW